MLLVDTERKSLIQDVELKTKIAKSRPYGEWLKQQVIRKFPGFGTVLILCHIKRILNEPFYTKQI